MATYQHQGRDNSSRHSDRSDNQGRYKLSVSGPSFHIEFTFNPPIQSSVLVTDHQGRQTKIVVDVKEVDTSELPMGVQTTDHHDGNSDVGSDRPDEEMTEIGSLRSDEGLDRREVHCTTCTCAVSVRPRRSLSIFAPCMPEE
ncbi:uncharacterized protein LOC105439936 [Strongylocentrotus purpuratus]|uniref:Uncharacterized protein n=1 Tax=Strongylocentrotus purpuratus TaxID=7668 RepID=A0A7M7P672_STRPU|nr:uncharacterized protein LOC105439936 [Strongylocentrotus purpuratus]